MVQLDTASHSPFSIQPARSAADLEAVAGLLTAYVSFLGPDFSFQDHASELSSLPGKYAPPRGEILLARTAQGTPAGIIALRPLDEACCEIKRLYVSPAGRRLGIGKALVDRIVVEAKRIGYTEAKLDTLPHMRAALRLYKNAGFEIIGPYYETPVADTIFLRSDFAASFAKNGSARHAREQ